MNKNIRILHSVLFRTSIVLLSASLIFYLIKWNSYPEEIGIHFNSSGQFDVTASKFYGFYPHIVGGILTAGLKFANILIQKKQTGLSLTPEGESHFKTELCLTLSFLSVLFSIFFGNWSLSVALQRPLESDFMGNLVRLMLLIIAAGILSEVITCRKHKLRKETAENPELFRRLCRLVSWLLITGGLLVLAESWERFPLEEELYTNADYYGLAYFANFDAYLDKHFLLIPHFLIIILTAVSEILSVRTLKAGNTARSAMTDKLKLFSSIFFFWWNLLLESQARIGMISVILYFCLCSITVIRYFRNKA